MPTIEELKDQLDIARKVYEATKKIYEDALIEAFPYKVGNIIRSSKGTLAKVIAVTVPYKDRPHAHAILQKKDGSFGKMRAPLWRPEWNNTEIIGKE